MVQTLLFFWQRLYGRHALCVLAYHQGFQIFHVNYLKFQDSLLGIIRHMRLINRKNSAAMPSIQLIISLATVFIKQWYKRSRILSTMVFEAAGASFPRPVKRHILQIVLFLQLTPVERTPLFIT